MSDERTVLLVEDDSTLSATIAFLLRHEGYSVRVVANGEAALVPHDPMPDAVILDVMLPGMDGFEVCRRLRAESSVPILMLTSRSDEVDRVVGLEIGADDYLTKPFSLRELCARLKALLRRRSLLEADVSRQRAPCEQQGERIRQGELSIDIPRHQVSWHGTDVAMTPKEFDLLLMLARHPGQVLPAERLFQAVWGYDAAGDTRTVPVHIRSLREKLENDPSQPRHIQTVRGVGYRFVA